MTLLISVLQATNIKYKGQLLFRRTGLWPNQPIFQWNPHHIGYSASPTLMITITSDVVVGCWRSSSSERHAACCLVQLPRKCLLPDLIDRRSAHTHRRRSTATTADTGRLSLSARLAATLGRYPVSQVLRAGNCHCRCVGGPQLRTARHLESEFRGILSYLFRDITYHLDPVLSASQPHGSGTSCLSAFAKPSHFLFSNAILRLTFSSQLTPPPSDPPSNAP